MISAAFALSIHSDAQVGGQGISSAVRFERTRSWSVVAEEQYAEDEYTVAHRREIAANAERPPRMAMKESLAMNRMIETRGGRGGILVERIRGGG